jgi:hypothetical protein
MMTQARDTTKWRRRSEPSPEEAGAALQLSASQIQELRVAAAKRRGAARRAFQAERTLKYWHGSARFAETRLGGSREAGEAGLAAHRTGRHCGGAHSVWSGGKRWEEKHPEAAQVLRELAAAPAQQAPTFRPTLADTRLTAKAAGEALRAQGDRRATGALSQHHGGGGKSHGLSLAESTQSEAAEKEPSARYHFCQSQKKTTRARSSPGSSG